MDKVAIDLLIEAEWVIPVQPHGVVLEDYAVAVDHGRIVALLPSVDARQRYAPRETVSRPGHALIPGLVNSHCHSAMVLMRGLADDLPLMAWLQDHIWPTEAKFVGAEMVADGTLIAAAELLRGGVTCVNEMYYFPEVAAATLKRVGLRAAVGLTVIEFPTAWASHADEYIDKGLALADELKHESMLRACWAPHAPYTVSDASFEKIRMYSDQLDIPVHVHLHETAFEVADALRQHKERPFSRLKRLGLVNRNLIAVHMTQLTESEIAQCAEAGVSIAHCPESNLKLASGFAPIEALRRAGVNIALGTDGAASNNDLDLIGEMKTAAQLAKAVAQDAAALDAASALRMATLGGARALGWDERIGSIEVGKDADLTLIALDEFDTLPVYHPISHVVYASNRRDVRDVWVRGERKLDGGRLTGFDIERLAATARSWGARMRRKE
ncbi:MAG TPA: TRZ/ATZ family hydrolase [Pseudomonadota bacterium]|nr:TRZ/ATZ family hydrolase [Rhodanobacteraceae bacterium]MBP9153633.1 TRZ/ATZ family hydrolase [Xanthomonadales bacterium]HQW80649.1 TRZ/ATZ family hydrolase [Pseudomonadota bacterium]